MAQSRSQHVSALVVILAITLTGMSGAVADSTVESVDESVDESLARIESLSTIDMDAVQADLDRLMQRPGLSVDQQARIQLARAHQHMIHGEYNRALPGLADVIGMADAAAKYRLRANSHAAHVASANQDPVAAFQYIYEALALMPEVEDPMYLFGTLHTATSLHSEIGAHAEAAEYAERAVTFSRENLEPQYLCWALQVAAEPSILLGRYNVAGALLQEAEQRCANGGELLVLRHVRMLTGLLETLRGQHEAAIETLSQALTTAPEGAALAVDLVRINNLLAESYLALENYDLAQMHAQTAVELLRTAPDVRQERDANRHLARIARFRGEHAEALVHRDIADRANEIVQGDSRTRMSAMLAARFDSLDKAYQIEQARKTLELEREVARSQQIILIIALAAFLVITALLGLGLLRARQQRQAFQNLSERDGLTGIYNRRHILSLARSCFSQTSAFSMALLDLDDFKRINDRHGHQAGDWSLTAVCRAVTSALPMSAQIGRTGGEEFVILLPGLDLEAALEIAEACRLAIESMDTTAVGEDFKVTASFGVTERVPGDRNLEEILRRADVALYQAKSGGRNCVRWLRHSDLSSRADVLSITAI